MEGTFAMTRDARLSALHRGGFGLRGRASLTGICAGSGPEPPGASGYEPPPQDAAPRSAFRIVSGDAPR
jgi:hypothetical protein